jgi:cell division septum initiation protein DivIVA
VHCGASTKMATRALLGEAARTLKAVTQQRDELQKQVEELTKRAAQAPTDAETLGAVLLTAKSVGDDLVAKATQEAAAIRTEAEVERAELFVRAQAQADAIVTKTVASFESVRRDGAEQRRLIAEHREEFVAFLRAALAQLDSGEAVGPTAAEPAELDGELLAQLLHTEPTDSRSDSTA